MKLKPLDKYPKRDVVTQATVEVHSTLLTAEDWQDRVQSCLAYLLVTPDDRVTVRVISSRLSQTKP